MQNQSENTLSTLNDSGTPPETRVGDANQALRIYQQLWRNDEARAKKRQMVKGLVDGNPPYRQADLKAAGLDYKCNVNWRIAESYLNGAVGAFYDLFSEAPTYATITLKKHKNYSQEQTQAWSRIATQHFDWLLRYEPSFDYNIQRSQNEMVMYGCGPLMFQDALDWRPTASLAGQLKVPERALSNTEYWELCTVEQDYLCDQLWKMIRNEKEATAMGWNVERVKQAIIHASPESKKGGIYLNWEWHQQMLKNGSIYYAQTSKIICVAHIFFREFAKRGENKGRISHGIIIRDDDGKTPDKFLFQKVGRYADWPEAIHPMYYDVGGGGFHHSVTGMGVKMYSAMEFQNRLLCNNADKAFTPKLMFKPTTSTGVDNFSLQQHGDYAVLCLDSETEILTQDGWIGVGKMNAEHKVANWKQDGTVFFDNPRFIIERPRLAGEKMVYLETLRHSIRVTEHHKMLVKRHGGDFKLVPALQMVGKKAELPISGIAEPLDVEMPTIKTRKCSDNKRRCSIAHYLRKTHGLSYAESNAEALRRVAQDAELRYITPRELSLDACKLIGFWLGDGSRTRLTSGGVEYKLCQSAACVNICAEIERLVKSSGIDFIRKQRTSNAGGKYVIWSLPRGTGFGPQKRRGVFGIEPYLDKKGSRLLWGLNCAQFDALLDGLCMADGTHNDSITWNGETRRMAGVNRAFFDLLQAIASVRGYRATILTERKPRKPHYKPLLTLSVSIGKTHSMTKKYRMKIEIGWKPETVWCVTSTSGNIITRRRGTVTITGNSEGYDAVQAPIAGMMEEGVMFNREITNLIASNLSQYRSNTSEPVKGNPDTATKVKLDASKEASLQKTQMNRYYQQQDGMYSEVYRRAAQSGVTEARAKEFQDRCKKDGVPLDCLREVEYVKASRVVGQGSEFLRQQSTEFLFATVLPMLPENGREHLIGDVIASRAGQSAVERYYPTKDISRLPDDQYAWAMSQVADMKIGVPAIPTDSQNPMIFAKTFLDAADQAAGSLQQGANPQEVAGFLDMAGQAIAIHLQRLSTDPSRKQQYKEMEQQFQKLAQATDQLKETIQQQAQEQQMQQQRIQQQQMMMQSDFALAKEKQDFELKMKADKTQFSMMEKGMKSRQSMAIADAQAASDIRRKNLQAEVDRRNKEKNGSEN